MAAHTFKYGDYIKGGISLVKANLIPSVVAGLGMAIPVLGATVMVNYMRGLKAAKGGGKPIEIGALFKFDGLVPNFIAQVLWMLAYCCCSIPGMLTCMTMPIMADKPGVQPVNAFKGALQFGLGNLVGVIVLMIAIGILSMIPIVPLVVLQTVLVSITQSGLIGLLFLPLFLAVGLILGPLATSIIWSAYDDARGAVEATAAEKGVSLA